MSDNREPDSNGNPWLKSLLVWGGIFLALLFVVTMFGGPREATGSQLRYSDFRSKVAEGSVDGSRSRPTRSPASSRTAPNSPPCRWPTTPS